MNTNKLELLVRSVVDFREFITNIFYLSFDYYVPTTHILEWAELFQHNDKVAILSARKHLKSTTLYAYVMWKILTNPDKDLEILYISYKTDMAQYHTKKIKELIRKNPYFVQCEDLTTAEGILKYSWDGKHKITVEPEGILSFKRGRHPDIVICDDILADPSQELNLTTIEKTNRIFFSDVMSLPKEGGQLLLVGTPQHQEDLFFKIKKIKQFVWKSYPAILDEVNKKVLWPELFSFERLTQIKQEIGDRAFRKEYMCSPVWTEKSFFTREQILSVVNPNLRNLLEYKGDNKVYAGFDVGKHSHPSHLAVFEYRDNKFIMIYHKFFDNMDYFTQVKEINKLIKRLKIDKINYDATRGELEGFREQGIINKSIWNPVKFKTETKYEMATNLEKIINNKEIEIINDERLINQMLVVNNDLEALETPEGHGDCFWSVALALYNFDKGNKIYVPEKGLDLREPWEKEPNYSGYWYW